jgi:tetratricopeptide (TPR) repeat protein/TolB-like protein
MIVRPLRTRHLRRVLIALCFLAGVGRLPAQQSLAGTSVARPALPQEGIFLVFPFENVGSAPHLDWLGEGLEELTIQRLSAAGQQVYSHNGRINEMDHYGLPAFAKLSRATMLHIAQELDADFVVFGNFTSDGKRLTVNARVLRVSPIALLPVATENGSLSSLMDLHTHLVWELLNTTDHAYPLRLAEFSKLQRPLSLAAFEQYIRGLIASDDQVRLRDLREAMRLEPDWPDPAFALGEVYFQRNDCSAALPWFARVPRTHERGVEALFSIGVCRLRLGQPDKAQEIFASLQEDLRRNLISGADLPEILNNLGLSLARQGNFSPALSALGRARDVDPDEDDYPFNLGLLALQQKEPTVAATHFEEAVHREPDNAENRAFLIYALDKQGKKSEADAARTVADEVVGEKGLPLLKLDSKNADSLVKFQRVKAELDTTSLRLELEGPRLQRAADSDPTASVTDSTVAHLRRGRQEVVAGRLDAAEQEFRAALTTDPHNASAHDELGEIYRRRGKLDDAVNELQLSLASRDSAAVRTTLARVYLEQKKPDLARIEVEKAVKLAPHYSPATELLEHLQKNKPTGGAQ